MQNFSNRDISDKDLEIWNESMFRKFDPDLYYSRKNLVINYIERKRIKAVIKLLDAGGSDKILDVGCGGGNILENVEDGLLSGVDISHYILSRARERVGNTAYLIKANAERLPFPGCSFDKVYCSEVLEHVINPKLVVEEMRRILKPSGVAVFSIPNEGLINFLKSFLKKIGLFELIFSKRSGEKVYPIQERMDDVWHIHSFNLKLLREVLSGNFRIIKIKRVPYNILPLKYVVICNITSRNFYNPLKL